MLLGGLGSAGRRCRGGAGGSGDPARSTSSRCTSQSALEAHALYKRDVHYLVSPHGKVLIIDELMGRVLVWRRWSHGLHQAVDAKENLNIQEGSRTVATPSSVRSVCWAGLPLSGRREAPRGNGLRTRAAVLRALDVS